MPSNYDFLNGPSQGLNQQNTASTNKLIGRVVEDKEINSRTIKVFVKDLLPYYSGDLKPKTHTQQVSGGNFTGENTTANFIYAEWLGDESNRRFPPDVKKDEQVEVIIKQDQDKAFWRSLGRDDDKRRTERIEWNAANTPNGPTPINRENSYSISMDTQDKKEINIQTSKTAGEKYAYIIKINAAGSTLHLSDDNNNEICIESEVPRVYMRNTDGTLLELAKKNLSIIVPEDFLLKVGRQAVLDIPAIKMVNTSKAGVTVWESAQMVMKMQTFLVQADCIGLKGCVEANNIVSGQHYATGYATIDGAIGRAAGAMQRSIMARSLGLNGFSTYKAPSIDIFSGIATRASNTPNVDGGFTSNRRCAAWEEVFAAFNVVAQDLEKIDSIIGYGNNAASVRANAEAALMTLNTGK